MSNLYTCWNRCEARHTFEALDRGVLRTQLLDLLDEQLARGVLADLLRRE